MLLEGHEDTSSEAQGCWLCWLGAIQGAGPQLLARSCCSWQTQLLPHPSPCPAPGARDCCHMVLLCTQSLGTHSVPGALPWGLPGLRGAHHPPNGFTLCQGAGWGPSSTCTRDGDSPLTEPCLIWPAGDGDGLLAPSGAAHPPTSPCWWGALGAQWYFFMVFSCLLVVWCPQCNQWDARWLQRSHPGRESWQ